MVLETNVITKADEAECLYMAEDLGQQVLVLFDRHNSRPGGGPSDQLLAAARRDGNEDANLWLVSYTPQLRNYRTIDLALGLYVDLALGLSEPVNRQAELPASYDRHAFEALR
jgi:hypothetical protein